MRRAARAYTPHAYTPRTQAGACAAPLVLRLSDVHDLLAEQRRALAAQLVKAAKRGSLGRGEWATKRPKRNVVT